MVTWCRLPVPDVEQERVKDDLKLFWYQNYLYGNSTLYNSGFWWSRLQTYKGHLSFDPSQKIELNVSIKPFNLTGNYWILGCKKISPNLCSKQPWPMQTYTKRLQNLKWQAWPGWRGLLNMNQSKFYGSQMLKMVHFQYLPI